MVVTISVTNNSPSISSVGRKKETFRLVFVGLLVIIAGPLSDGISVRLLVLSGCAVKKSFVLFRLGERILKPVSQFMFRIYQSPCTSVVCTKHFPMTTV